MEISWNNKVNMFVLFMSMLLTYAVFFQQNTTHTSTEISIENTISDTDLELYEYDFLFTSAQIKWVIEPVCGANLDHRLPNFTSSSLSVWQPPKLV